jgi:hypothetical protein
MKKTLSVFLLLFAALLFAQEIQNIGLPHGESPQNSYPYAGSTSQRTQSLRSV